MEKQVKYKGIAQVRLEQLLFKESRELNKKNLERLKANFRRDDIDSGIVKGQYQRISTMEAVDREDDEDILAELSTLAIECET